MQQGGGVGMVGIGDVYREGNVGPYWFVGEESMQLCACTAILGLGW